MSEENPLIPDHTLASANIAAKNEPPQVYAVSDLRAYVKPDLAEELAGINDTLATCGTEVLCTCVPVETCACHSVSYHSSGCASTCSCEVQCNCCMPYYYPY